MSAKTLLRSSLLAFGITVVVGAFAGSGHGSEKEAFDPGEMIMGHIADDHGWHLWGHTSVPLPVIIYEKGRGITTFMSSRFDHGHAAYEGYALKDKKIVPVDEKGNVMLPVLNDAGDVVKEGRSPLDFSITKNVAAMLFSMALLLIIFLSIAKSYGKRKDQAPSGIQGFFEPIIVFLRDEVAKPNIGPKYERYMPFLLTVFFFILFNNLLGLIPFIPGGANVTGSISVAFTLAAIAFIIILISANKHYWRHVFAMPGVPWPVLLILTPVEILGVFLRPAILMIRLFANITAGHIIVLSFFALIFIFGEISTGLGYGVSIFTLIFTVFMSMLELLVAFIQAFVFTFLSAMYFGAAVEEAHEH